MPITEGAGQLQSSQAVDDPGPAKGSPERSQVSPPSSQGSRDFLFNGSEPEPTPNPSANPGQVQTGLPAQGNRAPAPTDPNLAPQTQAQGQASAAATAAQWQSIRDAAQGLGYRFPAHIQDDHGALQHMIHSLQQRDYHAQLGQRLAPHAPQLQQMLATNPQQFGFQGQVQQQAAPTRQAWEAPEFDKRWLSLVEQDPQTGMILAKPGVPVEIGQKVQNYMEWKDKYDANPSAMMNEMVRQAAREEAQTLYQQQFQQQSTQRAAQDIIKTNSTWLYLKDNAGRPVPDWQGQPQLSPAGQSYVRHLQSARSMGVSDPAHQDRLAKQAMQNEYYAYQAQQSQAAAANPAGAQFSQQTTNTAPHQGMTPQQRAAQTHVANTDEGIDDLTLLKQSMRKNMQSAGLTDADIMNQFSFNE